jgi:DNA invertase Pin-like site-specific DNA recombinase
MAGDGIALHYNVPSVPVPLESELMERKDDAMSQRVAIYARVSTINHGQDVSMQTRELRQFAEVRGWQIVGEFVDAGVSGSKERRPQLDRLMSDCRRRRVDAVIVYRYDRFARSLRQLVNALEEFRSLGIEFISLHEGVDTSTPNGRLVFGIFASIAEFERELIRDRVKSGIAAARAKGRKLGRPRVAVDAARIVTLRASGLSWPKIAADLGVSVGTVYEAARELSKIPSKGAAGKV